MPKNFFKFSTIERPPRAVRVSPRPGVSPIPRAKLLPAAVKKTEAIKAQEAELSESVAAVVGK